MSDPKHIHDAAKNILWSGKGKGRLHVILDTARDDIIYPELLKAKLAKTSLFLGDRAKQLISVAPYLAELDLDNPFSAWLIEKGWGKSWGIFAESEETFRTLRQHFRNLLHVSIEGKSVIFRFYDPRVFRRFLPTCDVDQLTSVFGPVRTYYVEGEDEGTMLQYSFSGTTLRKHVISLDERY